MLHLNLISHAFAGAAAGALPGQTVSTQPGQTLIREDNALATLQLSFPKEVKYDASRGMHVPRSLLLLTALVCVLVTDSMGCSRKIITNMKAISWHAML